MWPRLRRLSIGNAAPRSGAKSDFSFKDLRSIIDENPSSPAVFHRVRSATWHSLRPSRPLEKKKVVLYFTSLRIVRKTFEDCCAVKSILKGFRISVDERDLSMDSGFLKELKKLLGKKVLALPQVFIGGRYIGGYDEVLKLNERGELKNILEGVESVKSGVCEQCGGLMFMLCEICSGSHKYFSTKLNAFRSCNACNENGLVRCSDCCGDAL